MFAFFYNLANMPLSMRMLLWVGAWSALASLGAAAVSAATRQRMSAAARSLLWTAFFLVLSAGPILDFVSPKAFSVQTRFAVKRFDTGRSKIVIPALNEKPSAVKQSQTRMRSSRVDAVETAPSNEVRWSLWIGIALLLGIAVNLSAVMISWVRMRRLCRRATPLERSFVHAYIQPVLRGVGVRTPVAVRVTGELDIPATHGFIKPVLLLPSKRLEVFFEQQMRGALAHEIAHIKRRDFLRNLLSYIVRGLFWFAAPVWLAHRAFRRDVELASDDLAIAYTGDRKTYAESLGKLAIVCHNACQASGCSLFLFKKRRRTILLRIQAALSSQRIVSSPSRSAAAMVWLSAAAALGLTACTGFSAVSERGAQERPVPTGAQRSVAGGILVRFPAGHSVGALSTVDSASGAVRWQGEARGVVRLAEEKRYAIAFYPEQTVSLAFLKGPASQVVRRINLSNVTFASHELAYLESCTALTHLNLTGAGIGDDAIDYLAGLKSLTELRVDETKLSSAGLARLRKRLTGCLVTMHSHSASALRAQSERQEIAWPKQWRGFGAFEQMTSLPDSILRSNPEQIQIGETVYKGVALHADDHEWLAIEPAFGSRQEGKTVWLFTEIMIPEEMTVDIWAAADWWMSWYIDGIPVYNTRESGNQSTAYAYPNHTFSVRFSPGRHIVAVQVASGSKGWGLTSAAVPVSAYQTKS